MFSLRLSLLRLGRKTYGGSSLYDCSSIDSSSLILRCWFCFHDFLNWFTKNMFWVSCWGHLCVLWNESEREGERENHAIFVLRPKGSSLIAALSVQNGGRCGWTRKPRAALQRSRCSEHFVGQEWSACCGYSVWLRCRAPAFNRHLIINQLIN